jgi:hypothetical protein
MHESLDRVSQAVPSFSLEAYFVHLHFLPSKACEPDSKSIDINIISQVFLE